jgi:hypothetical protein
MSDNISISGGSINAGNNVVIGSRATIQQGSWPPALTQPIAALEGAIDAFDGAAGTREAMKLTQSEIADELGAGTPDKGKILTKLELLRQVAGPATAIVEAAAAVAHAIAVVL